MITLGKRLKTLRHNKHITQGDVADYLSIDRSTISKYEKDVIHPDANMIKSLAIFFNVSADYLIGISDVEKDLAFENLSEYQKCGLILAEKLYDSGFKINQDDISDLELVCVIILKYRKNKPKKVYSSSLGSRLKTIRINHNITQKELAERFSINRTSVSKYEKNTLGVGFSLLVSLSTFYNVSVDYLLGISDIKNNLNPDNLSEYIRCGLILADKLYNSGFQITKSDIEDLTLMSTIFLKYKYAAIT